MLWFRLSSIIFSTTYSYTYTTSITTSTMCSIFIICTIKIIRWFIFTYIYFTISIN
nr:MAG TPA: hypothetical protein [Caudoviricetes sp.]